ncbi:MAG: hypothetical protein R3C19_19245 [Planctomycetaceae bacterium]
MEQDPGNLKNIENVARNLYMMGISCMLLDQAAAESEANQPRKPQRTSVRCW